MPTSTVNLLTQQAVSAALSLGDTVVAIAVAGDEEEAEQFCTTGTSGAAASRSRCCSTRTARSSAACCATSSRSTPTIAVVLIPEIVPRKRRHEILHNQRGRLLESALKARTQDVVIASLPFHIDD